jgi:hypothetical protein
MDYLEKQRLRRAANGNAATKKYEKTKGGKIMRTYRNMKSRCAGIQPKGRDKYINIDILPKEDFYAWSMTDNTFNAIFTEWVASNYCRKLTPSIDRIDASKGYTIDNIRWLTLSENSRLTSRNRNFTERQMLA